MPHFAANLTVLFTELPFEERFEAAARAGFRAVECLFPYDWSAAALEKRLRDAGLELVLFNAPPGDWEAGELGLAALPGRQQDFRDAMELALDYAATLGAPQIHVMAGAPPADCDPATALGLYGENLAWVAERAAGAGLKILIEPINDRDHPGYALTTADQARAVIAAVGKTNLALQYDVYHAQIMGGNLTASIQRHFDLIAHVQVSGAPGRHEPDRQQEVNYPYIFDLLDELGYGGWVGCEYRPRESTWAGLAWAAPYGIGGAESGVT